jgi:hypothetical protein
MHTQWAEDRDSTYAWVPKLATLPIEVHDTVANADADETVAHVLNGTDASRYSLANPAAPSLAETQRIVLYVGGETLPVNKTYCDATPSMRPVKVAPDRVLLGSALCDGPRLVVTERQELAGSVADNAIDDVQSRLEVALELARDSNEVKSPYAGE